MPKKKVKATLEAIADEMAEQSDILSQIMANQSAVDVKVKALAGKLHDTQTLVLQNTRSIANG